MKRNLLVVAMLVATVVISLPTDSFGDTGKNSSSNAFAGNAGSFQNRGGKGRKFKGRKHSYYGYKNYGQYRRTQVGNRRYRLVRRYYWRDGVRLSRFVRVYF